MRRATRRAGFTVLETAVAVAVLAIGLLAAQRLIARSTSALTFDQAATSTTLFANALLSEAHVSADGPQEVRGVTDDGLHYEREVRATADPELLEVVVRVHAPGIPGTACELVEVMRAGL